MENRQHAPKAVCEYSKTLTLAQKMEAAQILWYTANWLYSQGDEKVLDWFKIKGVDEVRRICRGVYVVATFWESREFLDNNGYQDLWPNLEEDYAPIYFKCCLTYHSMNVNRNWKEYLLKEAEAQK